MPARSSSDWTVPSPRRIQVVEKNGSCSVMYCAVSVRSASCSIAFAAASEPTVAASSVPAASDCVPSALEVSCVHSSS